jgi:hypothetical protein
MDDMRLLKTLDRKPVRPDRTDLRLTPDELDIDASVV